MLKSPDRSRMPMPSQGRDGSDGNCIESFTLSTLKRLVSNREQTLGKLRVWKTQEKRKREQREFVEVNNFWAAQSKFLFDRPHLPQVVPKKAPLEEF